MGMCRGMQCHERSDVSPRWQQAVPPSGFDLIPRAPGSRLSVTGIAHCSSLLYPSGMPILATALLCLFFERAPLVKQKVVLVAQESTRIAGGSPATKGEELAAMQCGQSSQSPQARLPDRVLQNKGRLHRGILG